MNSITPPPPTLPPSPLGRRTLAYVLDKMIISAFGAAVVAPLLRGGSNQSLSMSVIGLLTEFIYAGYFYSTHAATPGKMLLGLRVARDTGQPLDFVAAGLRDSLGKLASVAILGIGYFIAFFREDRHALHDLIFKTTVLGPAPEP